MNSVSELRILAFFQIDSQSVYYVLALNKGALRVVYIERNLPTYFGFFSALLRVSFRPSLHSKNWSLDPIIQDACAGEMFENILFLISVIVTFTNFSLI